LGTDEEGIPRGYRGGLGLREISRGVAFPSLTFKHRITSGKIESFNNQIARLIHRACGMTNLGHLFLKMRAQSLKQT
jgi:hypothetical protein